MLLPRVAGSSQSDSGKLFSNPELDLIKIVDNVEIHYINGMFTDPASYHDNLHAIEEFLDRYFTGWGFDYNVSGSHNRSEQALIQVAQVARHKFQDAGATFRSLEEPRDCGEQQYGYSHVIRRSTR